MQRVAVPGGAVEVDDLGAGEPVLLLQTALTADELRPVADAPALARCRRLLQHRRGYAGSAPADTPGSIRRDASDAMAVLDHVGVARAHVVGLSFSGAVAMQLAADVPARVATLTLVEPPPVHVPSANAFRAANAELLATRDRLGEAVALDRFLGRILGSGWREATEALLPGATAQMARDVGTFLDVDLPALLDWRFDRADARRVTAPVLHVGGTDSGPWFAEVRVLVLDWFRGATDVRVEGADHGLVLTHPDAIADAIAAHVRRHPVAARSPGAAGT
jgi:pimeloyl-ACP methyl ester carboxylesterase